MASRLDVNDQVMADQTVTASAKSDKSIDLGAAGIDKTVNTPMCYMIVPKEDAGGDVVATSYAFSACEDSNADLSTATKQSTVTIAGSAIKNGMDPIVVPLPKQSMSKRYQGLDIVVTGGTDPTAKFDAFLVPMAEVEATKAYPARPTNSYPV